MYSYVCMVMYVCMIMYVCRVVYVCMYVCMHACMHVCVYMCVCNIWIDVKLPSFFFPLLPFSNNAGGGSRVQSLPPTKTPWFPW